MERENWNAKETIVGAQEKADKALSDAKYYVDTNYKNNNLTLITGDNAIQDARTGGEEYPLGLTLMDIGQGNTTGYPWVMALSKMKNIIITFHSILLRNRE